MDDGFTLRDFIPGSFFYELCSGVDTFDRHFQEKMKKYETPMAACSYLAWHALWAGTAIGYAIVKGVNSMNGV